MTTLPIASTVLAFGLPAGGEWIIILIIGVLIFGRRLPEVGRSLGRGIVEFKKGVKGIEEEIEQESNGNARKELPSEKTAPSDTTSQSVGGEGSNPYAPQEQGRTS